VIRRLRQANSIDQVFVATTDAPSDDPIVDLCTDLGVGVFRGSEDNVLERYRLAAHHFGAEVVLRVTADNPLVGPDVIDFVADQHFTTAADFTSTYHSKTFPNGTVVSLFSLEVLEFLTTLQSSRSVREHIVTGIDSLRQAFTVQVLPAPAAWHRADLRYCIADDNDFQVVHHIIEHFADLGIEPNTSDIIRYLDDHQAVRKLNQRAAARGY
jgi:spore coat polysaccharide biosynthesis protein SpsF